MQTIFGYTLRDNGYEKVHSYFDSVASLFKAKKFYTCLNKNIGYGIEQNARASFMKEFTFPRDVKLILAGDFINKYEVECKLLRLRKQYFGSVDMYTYLKTEVLNLVKETDGIFCIVLVDPDTNRLCIFSDQHGIIPLYYYFDKEVFLYGTSIKCIITYPGFIRHVNNSAIYELFKIGFTVPPSSLFENVSMLVPGELLEFDGELRIHSAMKPEIAQLHSNSIDVLTEEYYRYFKSSVLTLIKGFTNCTLLLSGGIDSAAIAAILSRNSSIKLNCLTIDLNYNNQSESMRARKVSSLFGIEHHVIKKIDERMTEYLPEVIWYNEAPIYNGITEYVLVKNVSKKTELVLTGDGNDLIWGIFNLLPNNYLEGNGIRFSDYYLKCRGCMTDYLLDNVLLIQQDKSFLYGKINSLYNDTGDFYNDSAFVDQKLFGSSCAFNVVGKMRVEPSDALFRFPYLDKEIEMLISSLPVRYKVMQRNEEFTRKYLFKVAIEKSGILPHEIIYTRKRWMQSPAAEWLRSGLKDYFEGMVFQNDSSVRNYFKLDLIRDIWTFHQFRKQDYSYFLMMVLTFELWHKEFIDSSS
ncbi:MAG: hypothetical protein IH591_06645 [Bacteroidales bacterium]|nr:hypothetical protein [Bacteroidales bacterium]